MFAIIDPHSIEAVQPTTTVGVIVVLTFLGLAVFYEAIKDHLSPKIRDTLEDVVAPAILAILLFSVIVLGIIGLYNNFTQ